MLANKCAAKDDDRCLGHLVRGTTLLKGRRLREALAAYTDALRFARSPPLVVRSLGNRSAVLFMMSKYEETARDVRRAIKVFEQLPESSQDSVQLSRFNDRLARALEHVEDGDDQPSTSRPAIWIDDRVEILYNAAFGRHVVARSSLERGQIVIRERPLRAVPIVCDEVCHDCMTVLPLDKLFCPHCTDPHVVYCSEGCQRKSWTDYHRVECGFTEGMMQLGLGFLALRLAVTMPSQMWNPDTPPHLRHSAASVRRWMSPSADRRDCKDQTDMLLTMAFNEDGGDMFMKKAVSVMTDFLLDRLLPFVRPSVASEKENTRWRTHMENIGEFVLEHILLRLICNAHTLCVRESLLRPSPPSLDDPVLVYRREDEVSIGASALPYISSLNHSCVPNVFGVFVDGVMTIRAIRPISDGQQLFISYGPVYGTMRTAARRMNLKAQYDFECQCSACEGELRRRGESIDAMRCTRCREMSVYGVDADGEVNGTLTCTVCRYKDISGSVDAQIEFYRAQMEERDVSPVELLRQWHRLEEEVLHPHNVHTANGLRYMLIGLLGEEDGGRLALDALAAVTFHYDDEWAIEGAHEMMKCADVLRAIVKHATEADRLQQKAQAIYAVHFA